MTLNTTVPGHLLDTWLPSYDVVITERVVIDANPETVFRAAQELDFMTVRTPLLSVSFFVRGLPARLSGKSVTPPPELRFASGKPGLPGWVYLGDRPGTEVVFGAVGRFWQPNIEWRDVAPNDFTAFDEPRWGKIGCHFLVKDDGPERCCLTYECRTATTDSYARQQMARYWWLIRPFVAHIMRATLRTIAASVGAGSGGRAGAEASG